MNEFVLCLCANSIDSIFFVIAWWFISARKWFKGPKINVEVRFTFMQLLDEMRRCQRALCSREFEFEADMYNSIICSVVRKLLWKASNIVLGVNLLNWYRKLREELCPLRKQSKIMIPDL